MFVQTLLESILKRTVKKFKANLINRGYREKLTQKTLSEVKFESRKEDLTQKQKQNKGILPFVTQYHPSAPNLKLNTHYIISFYGTTTMVEPDFQRPTHSTLKEGAFTERYTRQSKTIIKANTRVWESCRPVTPIFNYTNKTNREIGKQASRYVCHGHGKSRGL